MTMLTPLADTARALGDDPDVEAVACLFRALGEPSRLAILEHLHLGPHRVVDLVAHLGLAQSTVSKHLACLRDCGLVDSQPQGRASVFSLVDGVPIRALLVAAGAVLEVTGDAGSHWHTLGEGS